MPSPDVAGSEVTVDLAGTQPRTINRVQVSAMLLPGQNRFSALRRFEILTCVASALNAGCTLPTGFVSRYVSPADAFPGSTPRPVSPELLLRSFDIPSTQATHVRIRVLANQCTGKTDFQGEQDTDPLNNTDCRVTSLTPTGTVGLPARNTDVRAAEVELLSADPKVKGADEEKIGNDHGDDH